MTIRASTPYFILNGAAVRAIAFYEKALGAKTKAVQRFGDVQQSCPEAMKNLVMHAELQVGTASLMLSDGPGTGPLPPVGGVNVALDFDDEAELRRCFDALSEGGKVFQAVMAAPWGGLFASLTDRFNVSWMFSSTTTKR